MPDDEKKQSADAGARQRPKLSWLVGLMALLLVSVPVVKSCMKAPAGQLSDAANQAALDVQPGGPPSVVQVRETTKPTRAENRA